MQNTGVDTEIAGAEQALQDFRSIQHALELQLQARKYHSQEQPCRLLCPEEGACHQENNSAGAAPTDGSAAGCCKASICQQTCAAATPPYLPEECSVQAKYAISNCPSDMAGKQDSSVGVGSDGSSMGQHASASSSQAHMLASTSKQPVRAPAAAKSVPLWKQQVQQEKLLLQAQQRQAAARAVATAKQQQAQQQAAGCQEAQRQLPFSVQHSQPPSRVNHTLRKSLSMILQGTPAGAQQSQAGQQHAATAFQQTPRSHVVCTAQRGQQLADTHRTASVVRSHTSAQQLRSASSMDRNCQHNQANPSNRYACGSDSKQKSWAAADAQTDAETDSYLLQQWQQQHLDTAALVLQCAWRSRTIRLAFGRYMHKRRASVTASLQPAFLQWHSWCVASAHSRHHAQRAVLRAWQELLQLQAQLCNKVLKALRHHVVSGDMPALLMWRLCTSSQQLKAVQPSLDGMLASALLHRAPRMKQQECFTQWRQVCQSAAVLRGCVQKMLAAAALRWQHQQVVQGIRFWRMYTACSICEHLQLQLPVFPQRCDAFDAWLWNHQRQLQLEQKAAGLAGRLGVLRCFVNWQRHVHKMRVMRAAWSGVLLHTRYELARGSLSAFKANWREQQLQRRLLAAAITSWKGITDRNKAAAAVRTHIIQVAEARCKAAGFAAFQRFCRMSQLLCAAAVLKQWQARPLMLAALHAWLKDTLHATLYLCWWRWRRRAVARLRWRAALGSHMYRTRWLHLELVFSGWRKVAAVAKRQQQCCSVTLTSAAASAINILTQTPAEGPAGTPGSTGPSADGSDPCATEVGKPPEVSCNSLLCQTAAQGVMLGAAAADAADGSSEGDCCCPNEATVAVSLADHPIGHPWRPLLQRAAVMLPRGLRRLTGLRLGRAVRDLRELEGSFIVKDHESGAGSLLCTRAFARAGVSPGLNAMATAQLPMDVLWRTSCTQDVFWWQRVVGLLCHAVPHPDSWTALVTPPPVLHSTNSTTDTTSSSNPGPTGILLSDLQPFMDLRSSTCIHNCRCWRCYSGSTENVQVATELKVQRAPDAAASMAKARMRLRAGLALQPLQVPGSSSAAADTPVTPVGAATPTQEPGASVPGDSSAASTSSQQLVLVADNPKGSAASCSGTAEAAHNSTSCSKGSHEWPAVWSCADVACLCKLVQAEQLLETAVHALLGVGSDSTAELYDKCQQMTHGHKQLLQGDLLTWLLSAALSHDTAQSRAVLSHARARDELLVATIELRERAMALHLHIPHKFTLNTSRPCFDVRASWAAIIAKVEQERDWDGSSSEEDVDLREQLWANLLLHSPQHQLQQAASGQQTLPQAVPAAASPGRHPSSQAGQLLPPVYGINQQGGSGMPAELGSAPAAVMALAQAAAGSGMRPAARELAPGVMLAQQATAAVWTADQVSRPATPGLQTVTTPGIQQPHAQQQQQQVVQQQLHAAEASARQQEQLQQQQARQKAQRRDKQALATAGGLFGRSKPVLPSGITAARGRAAGMSSVAAQHAALPEVDTAGAEIFTGPGFLPIPSWSAEPTRRSYVSMEQGSVPPAVVAAAGGRSQQQLQQREQQVLAGSQIAWPANSPVLSPSRQQQVVSATAQQCSEEPHATTTGQSVKSISAKLLHDAAGVATADSSSLKLELQGILTDLLEPAAASGLPDTCPAGGEAAGASSTASSRAGSAKQLHGASCAAAYLAGACADWVLQTVGQQQGLQAEPAWAEPGCGSAMQEFGDTQLPTTPGSAPSHAQYEPQQEVGSMEEDSSSGDAQHSKGTASSPYRRAASAPVLRAGASSILQPGLPMASSSAKHRSTPTSSGSSAASCHDVGAQSSQDDEPWAALAVTHGLLTAAEACLDGTRQGVQSAVQHQHSDSMQGLTAAEQHQGMYTIVEQCSSQDGPTSCSSLPSIPSGQGFWSAQSSNNQAAAVKQLASGRKSAPTVVQVLSRCGTEGQLLAAIPSHCSAAEREPAGRQQQQPKPNLLHQQAPASSRTADQRTEDGDNFGDTGPWQRPTTAYDVGMGQLLPLAAAALQALHGQQHSSSPHQLLEGAQQGLSSLGPAQLHQHVQQLLLQAEHQRQEAKGHQQQDMQAALPVLPWEGEIQQADVTVNIGIGASSQGPAAVLSHLLTAPLSVRVAFWRQVLVAQQQHVVAEQGRQQLQESQAADMQGCRSGTLAHQLHQLAWSGLLVISSSRQPQHRLHQQQQQPSRCNGHAEGQGPLTAVKQRLRTYLAAHTQWRQQQQAAPPLAPAEKWLTLEHEEQVLDFITSLTIAVHQRLLRKHQGLPETEQQRPAAAPFGSSAGLHTGGTEGDATARAAATAAQARALAAVHACGNRVDSLGAKRLMPTAPRPRPVRPTPVYIVPRPGVLPTLLQRPVAAAEPFEPLQGWTSAGSEVQGFDRFASPKHGGQLASLAQPDRAGALNSLGGGQDAQQTSSDLSCLQDAAEGRQRALLGCGSDFKWLPESSWGG